MNITYTHAILFGMLFLALFWIWDLGKAMARHNKLLLELSGKLDYITSDIEERRRLRKSAVRESKPV